MVSLNYKEIRQLVRECLMEYSSKERGSIFGLNHKRISSFIGTKKIHPVVMSIIWDVIFNNYGEAIIEVRLKNHRKHVIFDKKRLIKILKKEISNEYFRESIHKKKILTTKVSY